MRWGSEGLPGGAVGRAPGCSRTHAGSTCRGELCLTSGKQMPSVGRSLMLFSLSAVLSLQNDTDE